MGSRRSKWVSGIGAVMLVGGLVLANYGSGVTSAGAASGPGKEGHPFAQILNKLDEILAAIGNIGGGEGGGQGGQGGQEGNHTLRWDQNLPAAERFVVLADFSNQAVLDKNTGLVWEQKPDTVTRTWASAISNCVNKTVGDTVGWRLPSVVELKSVQDPRIPAPPFVPLSVFPSVQSAGYWSATSIADSPTLAWNVLFGSGLGITVKSFTHHVWCVRGPMQEAVH